MSEVCPNGCTRELLRIIRGDTLKEHEERDRCQRDSVMKSFLELMSI